MNDGHRLTVEQRRAARAKTHDAHAHRRVVVHPALVRPRFKNARALQNALQHHAVALLPNRIGGDQSGALASARVNLRPCFFKPVRHQIRAAGHAAFVALAQLVDGLVAEFAAHHLVAQKRRIAHNHIDVRPERFGAVRVEQRVAVLDGVQRLQNRVGGVGVAVAAAPLNIANPDGDAGQFGGKFVQLQPVNVVRAGLHGKLGVQPQLAGFDAGELFHVAQRLEREVQKIARAAGRIEHAKGIQSQQKALIRGQRGFGESGFFTLAALGQQRGFDGGPFGQQRRADQGADDFANRRRVGVVGPELGALGRVQAVFKQRAENRRVDGAPVHIGGGAVQRVQVGLRQRRHLDGFEQPAIEPGNGQVAVVAAFAHGFEQDGEAVGGALRVAGGGVEQLGERPVGQQLFVFGEHAKQALHQKVGDFLAVFAALADGFGDAGELDGRVPRDGGGGFFRAQLFGVGEDPFQNLALGRVDEFFQANGAHFFRVAAEVRVNDDALAVGHDEQRRGFEVVGVVGELAEGFIEVASWFFVFPAEMAAFPDIGPAVARAAVGTGFLFGPALEAVVIGVTRLVHAEQVAQVGEVRLRASAFGQRVALPEGDELFRGHGGFVSLSAQFSSRSPATRSNSRVLLVTSVQSSARAWLAIHKSFAPMGVPAARSRVNCTA